MATLDQIIHAKAIELGKLALSATTAAGSGHPTTALSLAHLTAVLMYRVMRWDPKRPRAPGADRLVLSEGHAVPIVYAACADLGVTFHPQGETRAMTGEDLLRLRAIDSPIDGHPNPALGFPFFDAATGSLGQGLSVAAGLGAAARLDGIDKTIYCLIGDGEAREGQIWEAMDFIVDQKLVNVFAIFNCNELGQSDYVSPEQSWQRLKDKAEAFGWTALAIDGHDPKSIEAALRRRSEFAEAGKPLCLLARTVKGWGVPSLAGPGHHGTPVKPQDLDAALAALDARAAELGAAGIDRAASAAALAIPAPPAVPPAASPNRAPADFAAALAAEPKLAQMVATERRLSPRRAYGLALKALGAADPRVVALDGDVKNSTYALDFATAYPARYFEGRIAEQNMVSAAAGLAAAGKIPFVSSFGRFLERGFDQIEMALIGGLGIKLVGTHVGVTLASDGPSQMAVADIAFMRALAHARDYRGRPAMTVLTPSDGVSAYALAVAMAALPGACYLRAVRADLPILYPESEGFPLSGFKVLREPGPGRRKVLLAATGYMVHRCLEAAQVLAQGGIAAGVIDAYCLPLDRQALLERARRAAAPILAVEDNYIGGLASELAEAAAAEMDAPRVASLVVGNFPKSGRSAEDVLAYVHLSTADIVDAARTLAG